MSKDKNHSEAFERYLKGEMTPKEAHTFEREVLDDPFATEALEGFESVEVDALKDINALKQKISKEDQSGFSWMKIAASIALILTATLVVYFSLDQVDIDPELAMEKESIKEPVQSTVQDSIVTLPQESTREEEVIITEDELEIEEEFVAEAIQEVEMDGTKVADQETFIAEALEPEPEVEPEVLSRKGADFALADVALDTIQPTELNNLDQALQGKVAGVMVEPDSFDNADSQALKMALNAIPETSERAKKSENTTPIRIQGASSIRSTESASSIITGIVTDDTGEPLPGVNVLIKGTTTGTQTDLDGKYMLPKLDDMVLIFSFVGFQSYEFEVGGRTTLDVTMGGTTELQEVVVTGYSGESEQKTTYQSASPTIGNKEYKSYLEDNLRYPDAARENKIEGTVTLQLTIDPSGNIDNIEVKKSLGYGCDEEAIRLVREGPKWNAAEKDGNSVEDKLRVKVKFNLD